MYASFLLIMLFHYLIVIYNIQGIHTITISVICVIQNFLMHNYRCVYDFFHTDMSLSCNKCMIYCQLVSCLRSLQLKIVALVTPWIQKWQFDGNLILNIWNGGIATLTVRDSAFWVVRYYVHPEVEPKMAHEAY